MCTNAPSPGAKRVEGLARNRVTGKHDRRAAVFDPKRDGRAYRAVIRRRHADLHTVAVPDDTLGVLVHLYRRRRRQVRMMGDPVTDIEAEGLKRRVDDLRGPRGADDRQRCRVGIERGHPAGDDQVAEVGDVIAVQMGQQQRAEPVRAGTGGGQPLLDAAAAVDQEDLPARAHEC